MGIEPHRLYDASPKYRTIAQACRDGDMQAIKDIMYRHPEFNIHDHDKTLHEHLQLYDWGVTPLYCAVDFAHWNTIEWLLEKKADLNVGCSSKDSTIEYFVEPTELDLALGRDGTIKKEYVHWTPLWIAIKRGNLKLVRYLIQQGADIEMALEVAHEHCPMGFHGSLKKKMINYFHKIAYAKRQVGMKINAHITMAQAAYSGDIVLMRRLKIGGCTVEALDTSMRKKWTEIRMLGIEGVTPMITAVWRYKKNAFNWLLENVAPLNATTTGEKRWTALLVAVYKGYTYITMQLLAEGAKWDQRNMEAFVRTYCKGEAGKMGRKLCRKLRAYLGDEVDDLPDVTTFASMQIDKLNDEAARQIQGLWKIRKAIKKKKQLIADKWEKERLDREEEAKRKATLAAEELDFQRRLREEQIRKQVEDSTSEDQDEGSDSEEKDFDEKASQVTSSGEEEEVEEDEDEIEDSW